MRNKTLLTALAAAGFLSGATLGNPATAMTVATPSTLGAATTDTGVVQKAHYYRHYHHYYHRHYYGYYRPYYRPYYGLYGYYRPWGWHRWWW